MKFTSTQIMWPYVGVRYFDLRHWVREISSWSLRPHDSYCNCDFSCDLSAIRQGFKQCPDVGHNLWPFSFFHKSVLESITYIETGKLASSTCNLLRSTTVLHVIFGWHQVVHGWNPETYLFFPHIPSLNYYICTLV